MAVRHFHTLVVSLAPAHDIPKGYSSKNTHKKNLQNLRKQQKNFENLFSYFSVITGGQISPEEQEKTTMWFAALCALMASCGACQSEESPPASSSFSFSSSGAPFSCPATTLRNVLDLMWMYLFSERKEIRIACEGAVTLLPKASFMTVVDDIQELIENAPAALQRTGILHSFDYFVVVVFVM